jgi:hypothetical protein
LLRFRLYALVKDSHLAVALVLAALAIAGLGHKRPLATQQQRRREGLSLFIWIVAFADGLETSRSVLIYHPE